MTHQRDLKAVLKKHWGYDSFLPLQREAMDCVLRNVDSVVVLPTGGGKSLCYQAPAVVMDGTAVVVSPLISLMKDQVDSLTECGVPAARIDSSLSPEEKRDVSTRMSSGELKILYVAPERLMMDSFLNLLGEGDISFIAIDEAHCVSMWGHDFRPEYRQLGTLKSVLGGVAIHAYTATATPQVRADIAEQLHLSTPEVLIGSFDRPNLRYRVERRSDRLTQVLDVMERHRGESGIVYCIRRKDVDELCSALVARGHHAVPYHAGLADDERKRNQDTFIQEEDAVVVATVAFGMGIDKPNVRYVVHAGMPKSLEHYQQESGRAGRDGLEAECSLFYSGQDFRVWEFILGSMEEEPRAVALSKLGDMWSYCTSLACRHRALVRYFGQDLADGACGACDVCLGGMDVIDDALVTAQKILSCVVRLRERFGAEYTTSVLVGSREERVLRNGHDELSTYGILQEYPKRVVRDWTEQLVDQDYLRKVGEYATLSLTETGRAVLKGDLAPQLLKPAERKKTKASKSKKTGAVLPGAALGLADQDLASRLRALRSSIAKRKRIPAYVVFGDATLRELARIRPATDEQLLEIHGIGQARLDKYGEEILEAIRGSSAV
jgi:ATP-dependent DNA helicase RecQ